MTRRMRAAATEDCRHRFPLSGARCRLRFGALRAKTPRGRRVGTQSRPQSASVPGVRRGVARSPWSPWTTGSFVRAPRCPLFLPSAGKRRREERGSGCPDVSALSDCAAGQSRPIAAGGVRVPRCTRRERAPGLAARGPRRAGAQAPCSLKEIGGEQAFRPITFFFFFYFWVKDLVDKTPGSVRVEINVRKSVHTHTQI